MNDDQQRIDQSSADYRPMEPPVRFHKWQPITGLDAETLDFDFHQIDSLQKQWLEYRHHREESDRDAYKAFIEQIHRRWAIETGIIEGIYNIDRGTTQTLVEKGLSVDYIDSSATDKSPRDVIKVLKDHRRCCRIRYRINPTPNNDHQLQNLRTSQTSFAKPEIL